MTIERREIATDEQVTQRPSSVEDVITLEQNEPYHRDLEAFENERGSAFERIPFAEKEPFLLSRLDALVGIMRVNPLWKAKLDEAGVTHVQTFSDWQKVPIAKRQDLHDGYTVSKDMLVIPWSKGDHKPITSGGSSGEPIITVYRKDEFKDIGARAGLFWRRNLFTEEEEATVMNLFDTANGWAGHELVRSILEGIPQSNVLPIGSIGMPRVAAFWMNQNVTDLAGLPSDHARLARLLREENADVAYPNVKRVFSGGEFMDPLTEDIIKDVFPNAKIVNVYSSTQANHMAVQVEPNADHFRLTDDIHFLEIVDDEGNPVPYGTTGRIIVTRLMGNGDQPLRLDLQDRGSIELADPDDPLQARKLKLYGRAGDYIRVSSYDIKATDLLRTSHTELGAVLDLTEVQARQLVREPNGIRLRLAVLNPSHHTIDSDMQNKILLAAIARAKGFFSGSEDAQLHDWAPGTQLSIEFVTLDELEKTPAGKIHPFLSKVEEQKSAS